MAALEASTQATRPMPAASPFLLHKDVRGFVYEVETGKRREVR